MKKKEHIPAKGISEDEIINALDAKILQNNLGTINNWKAIITIYLVNAISWIAVMFLIAHTETNSGWEDALGLMLFAMCMFFFINFVLFITQIFSKNKLGIALSHLVCAIIIPLLILGTAG